MGELRLQGAEPAALPLLAPFFGGFKAYPLESDAKGGCLLWISKVSFSLS